jgi:hypothetical protein
VGNNHALFASGAFSAALGLIALTEENPMDFQDNIA